MAITLRLLLHLLLLRPLLRLVFGMNVHGREHLCHLDQFVLASNHNSHLDILLLFSALPRRQIKKTHAVAAKDYFSKNRWLFALVDFLFDPVWVDREGPGGAAIDAMCTLLDAGDNIIIFPEGTRGMPGELGEFHSGVGCLAERHPELPVVPAFLLGPERALPRTAPIPLPLWNHVFVGPPQRLSGRPSAMASALRQSIEALARSATAGRHCRAPERARGLAVAVLGIDGSGKSTLSARLAREASGQASSCLISDSLELFEDGQARPMQPLLKEKLRGWISRQAKQASSLARYKIPKLAELLLRDRLLGEARRWYGPELIFLDGCPLLNITAWSILYREELFTTELCSRALAILSGEAELASSDPLLRHFPDLAVMKHFGLTRLALPDAVLFLDVDPAVAMARIRSRGERMQVHETEEKLAKLRQAYLLVVETAQRSVGLPAAVLDGSRSLDELTRDARDFVRGAREGAMNAERIDVIATTVSGSISDWKKVEQIVPLFKVQGFENVQLHVANNHAEARRLAREVAQAGGRIPISAGGSGTFRAVLEGCCDSGAPLDDIRLGFLRKGSADLIGKVLGMPDQIEEAIAVFATSLREDRTMPCDVLESRSGEGGAPQRFVGYGGAEIFGRIPHFTESRWMKWYKGILGQLFGDLGPFTTGMALALLEKVIRAPWSRARRWRIRVDDEEVAEGRYQALIIVNGHLGPDLPFSTEPLGSGTFDLFALADQGMHRLPAQAMKIRDLSIMEDPEAWGMEHYRATSSLQLSPDTERPFPANVDGSTLLCRGSLHVRIVDRVRLISRQ